MSKDIARPITKRSRPIVDLPFSQWPSGKQKRAKGSNLRGKGGITKKQKYVNDILDKYTDSGKKIWNVQGDHHNLHSRVEKLKKTEIVQYQLFFSGDLTFIGNKLQKIEQFWPKKDTKKISLTHPGKYL